MSALHFTPSDMFEEVMSPLAAAADSGGKRNSLFRLRQADKRISMKNMAPNSTLGSDVPTFHRNRKLPKQPLPVKLTGNIVGICKENKATI